MSAPHTQTFFIPGPLPGMNDFIAWAKVRAGKWNSYAVNKHLWEIDIFHCIKAAGLQPMISPVFLIIAWQEPNKRRDPDNISAGKKLIFDALTTSGILPGDGWKTIGGFTECFQVNRSQPGVHVTLQTIEKGEPHA